MINIYSFINAVQSSEIVTPFLNYSPIFDIMNGDPTLGTDGRYYLCGGASPNDAVVGGSNTQKTGQVVLKICRILIRYNCTIIFFFDIEKTFAVKRLADMYDREVGEAGAFMRDVLGKRFFYMSGKEYDGNDVHDFFIKNNELIKEEAKKNKNLKVATVFAGNDGISPVMMYPPLCPVVDSASELNFSKTLAHFRTGSVDDGGEKRTRDLVVGNYRRLVHQDADQLGGEVGMYQTWTAQVVDTVNLTGRPLEKETTFLRQGKKIRGPKSLKELPQFGFEIIRGSVMKQGAEWMYPDPLGKDFLVSEDGKENPDLMQYIAAPYRNKSGMSGNHWYFIGSQAMGIQEDLTMYHNLKTSEYYGFDSNNPRSHSIVLCPDIKLGRTTIRHQLATTPHLRRAFVIAYQYWFYQRFDLNLGSQYRMPFNIFMAKLGKVMDLERLLHETVDYWFINPDIKKTTLSTFELMRIAVGEGDPNY